MNDVVSIDPVNMTITIEPSVSNEQLFDIAAAHGMTPRVLAEFPGITAGGAVQGASLESSSFKYGQFNDCCLEYEIVLGNGDVIIASPQQHSDLFYSVSGSYGSFGIVTQITV